MSFTVTVSGHDVPVAVHHYSPREERDENGNLLRRFTESSEHFVPVGVEHAVFCHGPTDSVHIQALKVGAAGLQSYTETVPTAEG